MAPRADPTTDRATVRTAEGELTAVGVTGDAQGEDAVHAVPADGVTAIEPCGAFSDLETARIAAAVDDRAALGVVRFDGASGLHWRSGDHVFAGP
jgi:hypothetical protein